MGPQLCLVGGIHRVSGKFLSYRDNFKTKNLLRLSFWESRMARFANGGSNTYLGWRDVQTSARARLIRGNPELLTGADIVKKLDFAVNFGGINSSFPKVNGD